MSRKEAAQPSHEEKLARVDEAIDAAAAVWKIYVRESENGLAEFYGRVSSGDKVILRPVQK